MFSSLELGTVGRVLKQLRLDEKAAFASFC
jgi:hypothetical protein